MRKLLATLAALLSITAASAQIQWAVVETSSNFLREEPGYDEENGAQELMGTVVKILDRKSYWVKVEAPDYTAWTNEMTLARMSESQIEAYRNAAKWICTAEYSHLFSSPSKESARICDFTMGDLVRKTPESQEGWTKVMLPSGRTGWVESADIQDFETWAKGKKAMACDAGACNCTVNAAGEQIVATAMMMTGTPYMWGGNTIKYVDCSGLTKFVYQMNGVLLPRNASQQVKVGAPVKRGQERKGDLVFFGRINPDGTPRATHVAIYIGDGKIIHASQYVRINSLDTKAEDGYSREPIAIRRILGHVGEPGIDRILK